VLLRAALGDFLAQMCRVLLLQAPAIRRAAAAGEALPRSLLGCVLDVLDAPLHASDAGLLASSGVFHVLPRVLAALSTQPGPGVAKKDTCSFAFTGTKTVYQDGFECVTCDLVKVRACVWPCVSSFSHITGHSQGKVMCRACFELCHKGHQATFKHRCNMYW
jgi:hypothetical protein